MTTSLKRLNLLYTLVQSLYFAAFAAFCGFQTALLLDRGFTATDVGLISAVRYLSGILAQPAIGSWLDRHPAVPLKRVIALLLGVAIGANAVLYATRPGLLGMSLIILVLGVVDLNLYPLMDSLGIQFINADIPVNYSVARGLGSLAYAVTCVLLGPICTALSTEITLLFHMVFLAGAAVTVCLLPVPPARSPQQQQDSPHSILEILQGNRAFTLMLCSVFFSIAAVLPVVGFLVNIIEAHGGNDTHLGLALFLMAASELPAALLFPRLSRRFGSGGMMLIAAIFMACKPMAFFLAPSLGALLVLQLIQMPGYGFFTPAAVFYTNENIPPADRVQGQTIMMTASNGLGGMVGTLLTGFVVDWGGISALLAVCTCFGLVGIFLAVASVRCKH